MCEKPRVRCGECPNQAFLPVTADTILDHLQGRHVIGVYPMLKDETCWFLAADFDKEAWREDVHAQWQKFRQQLHLRGFKESMEDEVICRMRLGPLKVDFMPADESILGFSNRWYHKALATAQPYLLTAELTINLLAPEYFVATKLEAWRGRGGNDPMRSHDLEDIINLLDGREELVLEIAQAEGQVRDYIAQQFSELLKHPDFEYAVQGNVRDTTRSELVFNHMEHIIQDLM